MNAMSVSSKGWVVIPAELRKKYRLEPGAKVQIVDYGGVLSLIPVTEDPISDGRGMLGDGPSLTGSLLEEHARELARGP